MDKYTTQQYRNFLRNLLWEKIEFSETDQNKGVSPPPVQRPYSERQVVIKLPRKDKWPAVSDIDLVSAIGKRRSHRKFHEQTLTLEELSFLLWATQGVRRVLDGGHAFRTVPSAGCRHTFETYLAVMNVESLKKGVYRYLPLEHGLVLENEVEDLPGKLIQAASGQDFVGRGAVTFIWTTMPYRMEWRYDMVAHKVIALDAGHVCQNLYLACEAVGCGTCAVAAYHQKEMDKIAGVDGVDEFVIYMAPVGKVRE